jgi:hypothetical protein
MGRVLAMFEERLLELDWVIEMKTGEEGGIAFRETFCLGESPTLGRLRSRMEGPWWADEEKE